VTDRRKPADLFGKMMERADAARPTGPQRRPSTPPIASLDIAEPAPRR